MAVAGLIALIVGLLSLLFWAVTSSLVFLLLIHAHRWAAFRRHQAYDYRSPPFGAILKLAAQQIATGLILIFVVMVVTIKFNVNPGNPRIEYLFFLTFFLSVVFLGQRQAKFLIPLPGLWSARIFWIPIGIGAQLLVFIGYLSFHFGNKTLYSERYEKERSVLPSAPTSLLPQIVQLRPSKITLSIPGNHIRYIHTLRLHDYESTYAHKFTDRVELGFLLPDFQAQTQENKKLFFTEKSTDLLTMQIYPSSADNNLDTNKAWDRADLARKTPLNESFIARGIIYVGHDTQTGLTEYHWMGGAAERWFISKSRNLVVRCMGHEGGWLILQPCDATHSYPNNLTVTYSFPYARLSDWQAIDNFVKATFAAYPQR